MEVSNIFYKEPFCFTRKCRSNTICIPDELINIIMNKLDRYEDKNNFSMVNSFIYENYHNRVKIYKLEKFLNKDYVRFYNLLQIYEYEKEDLEYLKKICIESIKNINTVWKNDQCGFYDLRFIFELMYHYDIINKYNSIVNRNFNIGFFKGIKDCIVKGNRGQTLYNIDMHGTTSLKKSFNPCSDKNSSRWVNLIN